MLLASVPPEHLPSCIQDAFYVVLVPPSPGEGPDCRFPEGIEGFGPISARIRGVSYLLFDFGPERSLRTKLPHAYEEGPPQAE